MKCTLMDECEPEDENLTLRVGRVHNELDPIEWYEFFIDGCQAIGWISMDGMCSDGWTGHIRWNLS